jgi:hypothetical protein
MATPLEVELKTYAHNKVGVHLKYEYDRQLDRSTGNMMHSKRAIGSIRDIYGK